MPTSENDNEEVRRLRRAMRDLVALSTLPAAWTGYGPEGIAQSLAEVLANTLSLDLIYVRLQGYAGVDVVEVALNGQRTAAAQVQVIAAALAPLLKADPSDLPPSTPDPLGGGTLRLAVVRFGHSRDGGVLVACSQRSNFPTEEERLLLGVGANQSAIVIQGKRVEQSLAEQGERLRTTLASIGDGVITTDIKGRITNLNAVAESLTGWKNSEAIGQPLDPVFRIINEQSRQPVENPAMRALQEGVLVGLANPTVLICKDGTERPIDDSAAPIRCKEGEIVGCVLVFRDVTERRAAERAEGERNRLVALRADVGTAIAAPQQLQQGLQACCEAVVRHLGVAFARIWTHDEAAGVLVLQASAGQYTHLDGPHSRIKVGEFKIGRIAKSRQPHLTNDVRHDPNISDPAWAEREGMVAFAGYPLAVEGRLVGVLAVFSRQSLSDALLTDFGPLADQIAQHINRKRTDDALRESELRYRLVGQAANDAIWDWDLVTNRVLWNEGVQHLLGYTEKQVGADATWWLDHIHPDDRDRVVRSIHGVIDGGGELWQDEYRYRREDGSYAEVFDRGRVVRNYGGKPVRMVGSMLDLTERKQVEEKLRVTAAALSEANRHKEEFLATLAHELRGPLAPLRNAVTILKVSHNDPAALNQTREMMERQLGQMVRLIDDLMDLSRINRGTLELRKERVELASIIQQAVEICRPLADSLSHEVKVAQPPKPIYLHADAVRLTQLFGNLLNNSCKYSEPGSNIWLNVERQGSDVVVSVKDTGIGIPPDKLGSIFEMFSQVDKTLERSQSGLGIGLSLVKRLVELHEGSIEAHSEGLGKGSAFIVRLPVISGTLKPSGPLPDEQPTSGNRRILVVDDNRDSADSLAMLLRMTGSETHTAHDGQAAVAAAEKLRPDAILLDIGLPRLNGYEACLRIRQQPWAGKIIIIACSGWGQEEDKRKSSAAGFNGHLTKPVDYSALIKLLNELETAKE